MNRRLPKLYPIINNLDQEGNKGYKYSIFPILNENLYENPKIFKLEKLAPDLESKL